MQLSENTQVVIALSVYMAMLLQAGYRPKVALPTKDGELVTVPPQNFPRARIVRGAR